MLLAPSPCHGLYRVAVGRHPTPGVRLVVDELGEGRVDDAQPQGTEPQAEVDIVVGDGQILAEAAQPLEHVVADHHARPRHRAVVPNDLGLVEVARGALRAVAERMPGHSTTESHDHAGVLHLTVGIEETCPHGADVGALRMLEHGRHPTVGPALYVSVQKEQMGTPAGQDGVVVDGRPVEPPGVGQHLDPPVRSSRVSRARISGSQLRLSTRSASQCS